MYKCMSCVLGSTALSNPGFQVLVETHCSISCLYVQLVCSWCGFQSVEGMTMSNGKKKKKKKEEEEEEEEEVSTVQPIGYFAKLAGGTKPKTWND